MHVASNNSSLESFQHVQQGNFLLYEMHNQFKELLL